jgi:hypothetical protein
MLNPKSFFALAVLAPILGATIPAEAAKTNSAAARTECFVASPSAERSH